jgi:(E)-4-hydroxy-3-methylbut-2-enyl-diphosphate synthase
MADADYGYVGKTPGVIALYRGRDEIRRVPEAEGVEALIALIREDGRWVDP